jgi:hypothetical protein
MMVWRKRNAIIKAEATTPSSSAILFFPAKENTQAASKSGLASQSLLISQIQRRRILRPKNNLR